MFCHKYGPLCCAAFILAVLSCGSLLRSHAKGRIFQKREEDPPVQVTLGLSADLLEYDDDSRSASSCINENMLNATTLFAHFRGDICRSSGAHTSAFENTATVAQVAQPSEMLVMAYYPDWMGDSFPPSKIDFQRFDWIDFAFAVPKADASLAWDDPVSGPTLLEELVTSAHSHNSYVKLSIGGWTGSRYFSIIVSTEKGRSKFAENILATYNKFSLDGIDIDWEYPGQEGSPGNKHNSKDTANFLLFLQKLRSTLPPSARITAAVESTPFVDNKGKPLKDLTEFAEVLDWVLIMNYDVWGSSSNPGPNAPLYDACGNSTQPDASAVGAFNAWTRANFPASKLVLGLPSYGYISSSKAQHLRTRSNKGAEDSSGFKVKNDDGDSEGQVQFRELIKQGVLVPTSDDRGYPTYTGSEGFETLWDGCSETPYIRSTSSGQIITYDSPLSLGIKAAFAKKVGMLGVNVFDVHGDTDTWDLVDSVRRALDLT